MNIQQFTYYVEAVRSSSYAEAGDALFVSPQTISKGIATMEKEYGVKLFTKNGRGVQPTAIAIALEPHINKILEEISSIPTLIEQLEAELDE